VSRRRVVQTQNLTHPPSRRAITRQDRPQPEGPPFLLSEDLRARLGVPERVLNVLTGEVVAVTFRDLVQRRQRHLGREDGLVRVTWFASTASGALGIDGRWHEEELVRRVSLRRTGA